MKPIAVALLGQQKEQETFEATTKQFVVYALRVLFCSPALVRNESTQLGQKDMGKDKKGKDQKPSVWRQRISACPGILTDLTPDTRNQANSK